MLRPSLTAGRLWLAIGALVIITGCSPDPTATTTTTANSATTTAPTTTSGPTTSGPTTPSTTLPPLSDLRYELVEDGLPFPIFLAPRPADGEVFLITKDGRVWQWAAGGFEVFLDITDRVNARGGEQGLLGMAWHPADPGRLFLHYSDAGGNTVVSEFRGSEERVVLRANQPAGNHNGGMIAFGADGYLYIGLGDGGGAGDRFNTGQSTDDLLGGLLRIDIETDPYGIPPDNPFAGGGGAPEVWAIGLRNPWRFWFDQPDAGPGLIYIGDVGQNAFEEINVAPAAAAGLNYGWPITEGLHCFRPASGCDVDGLTLPVVEVPHGDGGACSIAGGVVYRGPSIPELQGHYFYSDLCGGWLRSFRYADGEVADQREWSPPRPGQVISFGTDAAGEMYLLTSDSVFRITAVR